MQTVFLTGASGFVGSHALRHILTNTDMDVVCPVTFRHRGIPARLALALDSIPNAKQRVRTVMLDLTAPFGAVTDAQIGPIDYVLNFASESHVDRSITEPASFIQNNVALMTTLLDWARTRPELQAFVHVSTDEVYGPAVAGQAHREWQDLHLPSNPYSASKAAQESIAFSYWRTYDLPIILTNTMNIIGETQDPEKFFPMVLRKVLNGEEVPIHASAAGAIGSRFYLHARNQANGVLHVLNHVLAGSLPYDTESLRYSDGGVTPYRFHIVGEREVDNVELARMISEAAGRSLFYRLVDFHSSRPGHDLRYALDGLKLGDTGWKPPMPLEDSVRKTVEWTINHPEWLL